MNLFYDTFRLGKLNLTVAYTVEEAIAQLFWERKNVTMEEAPKNYRIIFNDKNDIPPDELEKQKIIAEEKKVIEKKTKLALIKQLKLFIVSNPYSYL